MVNLYEAAKRERLTTRLTHLIFVFVKKRTWVDHLEVFRRGLAAQFGSSVVEIILRKHFCARYKVSFQRAKPGRSNSFHFLSLPERQRQWLFFL